MLFINRNVNETFQINTTCPVVQFHLLLIKTSWSPSSICTSFASYYFHSNPFAVALRSSSLIFPIPNEVVISCNIAYCYIVSLGFQANRLKWSYDHLRIYSGSHFRYCRAGSDALCAMYIWKEKRPSEWGRRIRRRIRRGSSNCESGVWMERSSQKLSLLRWPNDVFTWSLSASKSLPVPFYLPGLSGI